LLDLINEYKQNIIRFEIDLEAINLMNGNNYYNLLTQQKVDNEYGIYIKISTKFNLINITLLLFGYFQALYLLIIEAPKLSHYIHIR